MRAIIVKEDSFPEGKDAGERNFEFHVVLVLPLQRDLERENDTFCMDIRIKIADAVIY